MKALDHIRQLDYLKNRFTLVHRPSRLLQRVGIMKLFFFKFATDIKGFRYLSFYSMKAQVVVTVVWMTVMMTMVKVRAEQVTKTELPDATLEVQLRQGPILANREEAGQGRYFYSVKGIPFAKPPVGDLRLKVSNNHCVC